MSPYINTLYVPTNSAETTTLAPDIFNLYYVIQTDFTTTIKDLMADFKESVK